MRRIPRFVLGHVAGAFALGLVAGAVLDLTAMRVFSSVMAGGAIVSAIVCWWRPGFEAASWKLWLVAWLANPLLLDGLVISISEYECLLGWRKGWSCLFAEVGPIVAGLSCLPPFAGLAWRWWARRSPPLSS